MTSEGDRLAELAKRRGFFNQSAEAYGGVAGFYTFGPQGAALKDNVEAAWRDRYVTREGHMEIDAPTILPESVFEASGHLETFNDMLVECAECEESHRADHLVEDHPDADIEDAEALPNEEVGTLIGKFDIACPNCGTALAEEPVDDFNLMFGTNIGPGSSSPGYLRPETAQGIFVDFPQWAEYARNQLPFGVAQIGTAYRNEISPRKSIIRVREFTQAELEHFIDPDTDEPPLERVEDVVIPLYSVTEQQSDDGGVQEMTVREAVDEGIIETDWLAYYLGLSKRWYERIGVDMDRFRYRQHLSGELSHYASECWDAEGELGGDWAELTGFATRGSYDLDKHAEYTGEEFSVFQQYDEPVTVERPTVDPEMSFFGPEFGGAAGDIVDELASLAERNPDAFDSSTVTLDVDGETYEVPTEKTGFTIEEVTESGEQVTPHIIEPSFGVGRLVYTVLAHSYQQDKIDGEERTRLALPPEVAPTTVGVFPLMDKDGLGERARELANDLREAGLEVTYDDSGAIGRRYRRQDEVGTPFCVTVDYDTLDESTVTVRERDSTEQVRVPISELAETLCTLRDGNVAFREL
ncbi:glycine--tRNA ligase [Halovenus rubra]|uniref:Glycine--tRNA ligase n=2 Tax=Halovenus rubra TaxID=869890 RepID=A0ACC7DVL1_9EURY|nr:glycine--tRNA ligase [Halovenus rubra]